jgi:GH15 family glucan-1,4-alpha-glucosidase
VSQPLEDYALIGDTQTAALVGRDGSIDWLCIPRFDSPACFAALLGDPSNGRWQLAPAGGIRQVHRRYLGDTSTLETVFETEDGAVRVIDSMPPRQRDPDVVRVVEGIRGRVPMRMELIIRFVYGKVIPWVRRVGSRLEAVAGPDALYLHSPVETRGENFVTRAEFAVSEGDRLPFVLVWHPSWEPPPPAVDGLAELDRTTQWWDRWHHDCTYQGPWHRQVTRSLITLKSLTYAPTGGIVAAPTTSLPEELGGVRNWDYRISWVRDATLTLDALLAAGFKREAVQWRDWLLRAVAGEPGQMQIMYGIRGERDLTERELPWLAGYEQSRPVRVGNAASTQFQLDVYGEVVDSMFEAHQAGIEPDPRSWAVQLALLEHLEGVWDEPDEGIWEVRGPRRHFTHSKVMAWVAFDRAVKTVEQLGDEGPVDHWRAVRDEIHAEVCERGFQAEVGAFTQFYGSDRIDASLLMIPLVGFLPASDDRVRSTVEAVERVLLHGGFVQRYEPEGAAEVDGLPPGEGAFLPCTFWLADCYTLLGRRDDALSTFERVIAVANDVGLLSEEYDVARQRLVGNFPQAFSHVSLVNSAIRLTNELKNDGKPTD